MTTDPRAGGESSGGDAGAARRSPPSRGGRQRQQQQRLGGRREPAFMLRGVWPDQPAPLPAPPARPSPRPGSGWETFPTGAAAQEESRSGLLGSCKPPPAAHFSPVPLWNLETKSPLEKRRAGRAPSAGALCFGGGRLPGFGEGLLEATLCQESWTEYRWGGGGGEEAWLIATPSNWLG